MIIRCRRSPERLLADENLQTFPLCTVNYRRSAGEIVIPDYLCVTPPPLPIVPRRLLHQHHALERSDTRFRSAARLLQSLWRNGQQLAAGTYRTHCGGYRKLGSRLTPSDAERGHNFVAPIIAQLARHELAYREVGALIAHHRLMGNLLSSQPLALNLFGPLRLNPAFGLAVLRHLLPRIDVAVIDHVAFEHSPGRRDPSLTADRSAFDVAIYYRRSDGATGLVAIELKYAESMGGSVRSTPTYDSLAHASGLFKNPADIALRGGAQQQLFREHLLAQAALMRGDAEEGHFILVAPHHNHLVARAASLYNAQLVEPLAGMVPFSFIALERIIAAYRLAGDDDYALALHRRYTDWAAIHTLVDDALASIDVPGLATVEPVPSRDAPIRDDRRLKPAPIHTA